MTTKEEYQGRLLRLADFLEVLPPERFDYGEWVGITWEGEQDLSCGTTACAFGWATTIQEFRDLGLCMSVKDEVPIIRGRRDEGIFYAGELVFGLSKKEFNYLFKPSFNDLGSNASAQEVAKHIREFVENGGPKELS